MVLDVDSGIFIVIYFNELYLLLGNLLRVVTAHPSTKCYIESTCAASYFTLCLKSTYILVPYPGVFDTGIPVWAPNQKNI